MAIVNKESIGNFCKITEQIIGCHIPVDYLPPYHTNFQVREHIRT